MLDVLFVIFVKSLFNTWAEVWFALGGQVGIWVFWWWWVTKCIYSGLKVAYTQIFYLVNVYSGDKMCDGMRTRKSLPSHSRPLNMHKLVKFSNKVDAQ